MGFNEFNDQDNAAREKAFRKITEAMSKRNTFNGRRGRLFPVFMTIAALAVLGSVLWFSYPEEKEYREINSVPLIRAEAGPMKEVPNDPGGMEIPYRDSTVFETLRQARADGEDGQVENLLSDSEAPISRTQMFAGINPSLEGDAGQEAATADMATEDKAADTDIETVAAVKVDKGTPPPAEAETTALAAAATSRVTANAPVPAQKPEEQAKSWANTEPAAGSTVVAASGGYLVQLASVRSRAAAQKAWASYQKQFPNELGTLKLNIDVADLGTRGTYYRVQGGAVSEARARAICSAIDSRKSGGCFVVRNR